ncbi:MAG TPA: restriction endonuclease [Thermoanaerobaculia bacterium]|nr:restriction endonuclease [Thermoanaerobaculia bacterium]
MHQFGAIGPWLLGTDTSLMAKRLSGSLVNLIHEATVRSFWRRKALSRFLRQVGIAQSFLSAWSQEESKRDVLDRLFAVLPNQPGGQELLLRMARDLAGQTSFQDLEGWEDSESKLREAAKAVRALRAALEQLDDQVISERERKEAQERLRALQEEAARSRQTLAGLDSRLQELARRLGTPAAGYDFQIWFYELMDFYEISCRRPYVTNGRQIDGAITVSGTTYLVELKFTADQAGAPDIDTLHKKVTDKADNTMGVFVSISGFSGPAIQGASGPGTPLLLLDHRHVYLALTGTVTFAEIIQRVRRHASQTGEALLPPEHFGG